MSQSSALILPTNLHLVYIRNATEIVERVMHTAPTVIKARGSSALSMNGITAYVPDAGAISSVGIELLSAVSPGLYLTCRQ